MFIVRFRGLLQQEFEPNQPRAHQAKRVIEGVDQTYLDAGGEVDGGQVGQAVEGDGLLRPDAMLLGENVYLQQEEEFVLHNPSTVNITHRSTV